MKNKNNDSTLKKKIIKKYQELSKKEKKIADFIIQNQETVFGPLFFC